MPSKETPSGSCEKTGGGEWTALREALLAKAKEWRRRECFAGSPDEACVYPFLAEELEALAAAAPADTSLPKTVGDKFVVANGELRFLAQALSRLDDVAPPPQDGQGAELLGPPRGGSSSDLAGPITISAGDIRKLQEKWEQYVGVLTAGMSNLVHEDMIGLAQLQIEMAGRFLQDLQSILLQRGAR